MKFIPHPYQEHSIQHIINHPSSGLFLDMGLGKTVSTLTAIDQLINDYFEVSKVLVIAPKRVAEDTWTTEVDKWDHLKHLRVSKIMGTAKQRIAALQAKADIYVIGRDNVAWLVMQLRNKFDFDTVVIDELSSFKNPGAQRFKALKAVMGKVSRVVGLTGTPAPNSLIDLWSQIYLLDMGERLGKTITGYRQRYFTPGKSNGHVVYEYKAKSDSEELIYQQIADICISMKAEDYLKLPDRIMQVDNVRLSDDNLSKYKEFEKQKILELEDEEDITAVTAAALSNKLLQYANGAVYDADRNVHVMHDEKLEALDEIIEGANGNPVLVFYSYKHDFDRITERYKRLKPRTLDSSADIKDWNEGKIQLLLAHPASAGHGLNLQAGGNIIVWFGLTWSLELYQQANARLHRQGQTKPVIIHHLITSGTLDEDVMKALEGKASKQDALMDAVKARVKQYRG